MKSILLKARYALSQKRISARDYLYSEEVGTMQIDGKTSDLIGLDNLNQCMDNTSTLAGRITLSHSLGNPSTDLGHIKDKQAATLEIIENDELRSGLEAVFDAATRYQDDFHRLLFGRFIGLLSDPGTRLEYQGYGYGSFRYGVRFLPSVIEKIEALPDVRSSYLTGALAKLKDFKSTMSYELLTAPVYLRPGRIMPRSQSKLFSFRFKPSPFKLSIILLLALTFYSIPIYLQLNPMSASMVSFFMFITILIYLPVVGSLDRDHVIYPFRSALLKAGEVEQAITGLGQLDELLSFYRYFAANRDKTCIPEVRDGSSRTIMLGKVNHPVLGFNNDKYIANDFNNRDKPLVFISGPNSGGKTALCKTLALTQIMAQSGSVILARSGTLSVTDRICYQAPDAGLTPANDMRGQAPANDMRGQALVYHMPGQAPDDHMPGQAPNDNVPGQAEEEGRFGTELRRTREIFFNTTKKSLVILDELSEGTSHQEETNIALMILNGFLRIGNATLLVSHNYDLARMLKDQDAGVFYKFYLENNSPTFTLADGISEFSHAELVAERIGFSQDDIDLHLKNSGL